MKPSKSGKSESSPSSLVDPSLGKGEFEKQSKAVRKAPRLRKEMDAANAVGALNDAIQRIDYIAILDFEATCDDNAKLSVQEVIEFPTVFLSTQTGQVDMTYHQYVRPEIHPTLTSFCTGLTGITQEMVDKGIPLLDALKSHKAFLDEHQLVPAFDAPSTEDSSSRGKKTFIYATCGDWDLQSCLPKQLQHLKTKCPRPLTGWCNLKVAFREFYKIKPKGMNFMLNPVNLDLVGRHHSGIDDCNNLARIVQKMMQDGWKPEGITGTTMRQCFR